MKSIALKAFDESALAGHLPDLQATIESWLEHHADGTPSPAMSALRGLAIDAICRNVLGLGQGPETETMTRDYALLFAGLAATVPVRIPGTTYGRAMSARDRLLARIRDGSRRSHLHRRRCGARDAPHSGRRVRGLRAHGRGGPAPRPTARPPCQMRRGGCAVHARRPTFAAEAVAGGHVHCSRDGGEASHLAKFGW